MTKLRSYRSPQIVKNPTGSQFDPLLDGRVHRISLGDFPNHAHLQSLQTSIHVVARSRNLRITTRRVKGEGVLIIKARGWQS